LSWKSAGGREKKTQSLLLRERGKKRKKGNDPGAAYGKKGKGTKKGGEKKGISSMCVFSDALDLERKKKKNGTTFERSLWLGKGERSGICF